MQIARYLLLGLTYLGLGLGKLPGLRMNRATIALVGSAFLIALGVLIFEYISRSQKRLTQTPLNFRPHWVCY